MLAALVPAAPAFAAETPELQRAVGAPQAVGAAHTLRQIPEACARLEGVFTGDAAEPYRFSAVRTSEQCQPRARFVDYAKARPSADKGWKLNDVIRVPSAACPAQQAVVRVWRLPSSNKVELDGQGQSRIYLEEAKKQAAAGRIPQCRPLAGNRASRGQCSSPRHQQLAQRRAVAVRLIFAVAPYADVAVLRQRGQQVQRVGGIGRLHLGLVVAEERIPVGCALRRVRLLHQLGAG
ncbi:hypothetical protein G6F57_018099 [Rhizopus arrhizus]|nr:hypothetical protein G6F57_018099 [Rhizopus arrhizus]